MGRNSSSNGAPGSAAPRIALTVGDPCGIGPELVLRALLDERASAARILVVGDEDVLRRTARELRVRWPFAAVDAEPPRSTRWTRPHLLAVPGQAGEDGYGTGLISAPGGRAARAEVERAVQLARDGLVEALVNGPVHKESLALAGNGDDAGGHTDLVARLCEVRDVGTLLVAEGFAVGLLTGHLPLRDALRKVRTSRIVDRLGLYDGYLRRVVGRPPRTVVLALNPHRGEGGRVGTEELREIGPAVEAARERGLLVSGPVGGAEGFARAADGEFDLVLAMHHDQAVVPLRMLRGFDSAAVTVGLPFVRATVTHGPAMDLAGRGTASPASLLRAIETAARHAAAFASTVAGEDNGRAPGATRSEVREVPAD
ncbi:MAG: hypothetical protein D6738_15680 [Acidobacteria bacterium]|nr:MAG: hypothetical protein D6738_15680 [Acidobacteriota bacterium]